MSAIIRPSTAGPAPPSGGMLTSAEIAAIFRISAQTVRSWHASGKLPKATRIGNAYLWRPEDVEAMIAAPSQEEL